MALLVGFLAVFAVVERAGVPLLTDPTARLPEAGVITAELGVGLSSWTWSCRSRRAR